MSRVALLAGLATWAGAALLLSAWPRLSRPGLADRLRPFHAGAGTAPERSPQVGLGTRSGASAPGRSAAELLSWAGDRLAGALGVSEGAEGRLNRVHSPEPAAAFRLRQAAASAASAVVLATCATLAGWPAAVAAFFTAGAAALVFLVLEQQLTSRSDRWKRDTEAELPVVAEQLAMMINSGSSLGAALARVAGRGRGRIATDLQMVVNRIQTGLSEEEALREWADRVRVESVGRLVSVLTVHRDATDVGRLVTAEARRARRDLHRRTLESLERRGQQVWVPVTVATLVPGAILLAVPFLAALNAFSQS